MFDSLSPLIWVLLTFPAVLLMQRWIHRHLRGVSLLLTGNINWSVIVYAIILFPGVLLHEVSHWVVANLLGVRTGRFSVLPQQQKDGSIRLGYVEYYKSADVGPVRESLIGGAPLVAGTAVVLLISFYVFGVSDLAGLIQEGSVDGLSLVIGQLFATNDFWLWLYLLFAVSNAMMPSAADRQAWPAFLALVGVGTVVLYILGFQDVMLVGLAGPVATVMGYLGTAFSMTIAVNIVFMGIIVGVEYLIGRVRGMHIEYGGEYSQVGDF